MHAFALFAVLALTIDGKLDDPFWTKHPAQQFQPAGGGEVRAVVAGRYLYVAARLPEPTGRITARSFGRNPAWEEEDLLRVTAGANIGYTDRVLQVNPLGAYSLEKAGHVIWKSLDVYPYSDERATAVVAQNVGKFLVAARVEEKSWTVEAAFPLSELSAPGNDRIYATIERVRAQRPGSPQRTWRWPRLGPAEKIPVDAGVKWEDPPAAFRPPPLGNREPPVEAGRARQLPALDDWWNDGAWRDTPAHTLLLDESLPRKPQFPAEVKLLQDGKTLAVLARCVEPGEPQASVTETDGPVERDDSFQVYLAVSGSMYAQFVVNPLGYLRDAAGFSGGTRISRPREWDSGAQVRVRRGAGEWLARIDIPLQPVAEALGEERIPGEWRVLFLRNRRARPGDAREASVLPVIESDTALCTARYRRLRLSAGRAPAGVPAAAAAPSPLDYVLSPGERRELAVAGMVERQQRQRAKRILEADLARWQAVESRDDWERFRNARIAALRSWMGPFPARTALDVRVLKQYAGAGYRRQNLVYRSRPGVWVTANLYLPDKPTAAMPGIVIAHSHHRPRTQAELQDMGILWARLGCAVLIMDQMGHGERIQTYPWNREGYRARYIMGMQWYVAGESLIKWMIWDVMRGIDLLLARPDVAPDKIVMLGAVAAGGEPAALAAALDTRIAAVAPFTYGEAIPELGPGGTEFPGLPDSGWGSWETTRNLPFSIRDGFLPWLICASVAPRRFVFSYELGWDGSVEKAPAWARYRKVFGFYGALDHLDEAHGFGPFPGPGECANIGPAQRKSFYPELKRWFGIPIPESEPDDRRPEAELASLAPEHAGELGMKMVFETARDAAAAKLGAARAELARLNVAERRRWLREKWAARLGDCEPNRNAGAVVRWRKPWGGAQAEGITLEVEPGIVVPMVLLRPAGTPPVVTVVSQGGRARLLANRRREIEAMLAAGLAVCLPDLRGTGETAADARRGPQTSGVRDAASELMLGGAMAGARLKDLRTVLAYLDGRGDLDGSRLGLWGDSDAPPNPHRLLLDEVPGWQLSPQIQRQAEPLGGILALLGALYEDRVAAVAVRRGLDGYLSLLKDQFVYVPSDVVVPDSASAGDLADIAASIAPRPLLLSGLVDGRNTELSRAEVQTTFASAVAAYKKAPRRLVFDATVRPEEWLAATLAQAPPGAIQP